MWKEGCSKVKWSLEYKRPDDFAICIWQKDPGVKCAWVAYRFAIVLYFIVGLVVLLFIKEEGFPVYKHLILIVFWCFVLQLVSFTIAFVITIKRYIQEKKNPELPPLEKMPMSYKILWCLTTTVAPTSLVVAVVFWFVAYNREKHTNMTRILTGQLINNIIVILDFCLNAFPYRFAHCYMPLLFGLLYILFSFVYQSCGGTGVKGQIPIYSVMDWRYLTRAILASLVDLVCVALVHCALCGLNILKHLAKKSDPDPE